MPDTPTTPTAQTAERVCIVVPELVANIIQESTIDELHKLQLVNKRIRQIVNSDPASLRTLFLQAEAQKNVWKLHPVTHELVATAIVEAEGEGVAGDIGVEAADVNPGVVDAAENEEVPYWIAKTFDYRFHNIRTNPKIFRSGFFHFYEMPGHRHYLRFSSTFSPTAVMFSDTAQATFITNPPITCISVHWVVGTTACGDRVFASRDVENIDGVKLRDVFESLPKGGGLVDWQRSLIRLSNCKPVREMGALGSGEMMGSTWSSPDAATLKGLLGEDE
ncbi:hypothetical protein LTR08_003669 [Meristemomyces frigidus]|nr:hypothetical protein LTR08_003669 [Meristemomyces frigidus]